MLSPNPPRDGALIDFELLGGGFLRPEEGDEVLENSVHNVPPYGNTHILDYGNTDLQGYGRTRNTRAMEFKDRLKAARRHAKLGQIALAEKVGINQTSISDLERGKSKGTAYTAQLAAACGVSAIWLAEGTGEMLDHSHGHSEPGAERPPLGGNSSRAYQQQKYDDAAPAHRQAVDEIADKMLGISEAQALKLKQVMELLLQADEPNKS